MNRLKLLVFSILLAPALFLAGTSTARAVDPLAPACQGKAAASAICQNNGDASVNPVLHIVDIAVSILALVAGIGALIMIMLGAFFLVTSAGNPENVAKARSRIVAAIIGLVIVVMSWTIVHFVVVKLFE